MSAVPRVAAGAEETGFSLKIVPWYGWVALAIVGHALYNRNYIVAISAISGYVIAKKMMGRI